MAIRFRIDRIWSGNSLNKNNNIRFIISNHYLELAPLTHKRYTASFIYTYTVGRKETINRCPEQYQS